MVRGRILASVLVAFFTFSSLLSRDTKNYSEGFNKIRFVFSLKKRLSCKKEAWKLIFNRCVEYIEKCKENQEDKELLFKKLDKLIGFLYPLVNGPYAPVVGLLNVKLMIGVFGILDQMH